MSTFNGKIKHFPSVSIDRFDGNNLESEAFLLSHCHEDHMIGLRNPEFTGPLYLSAVSAVFVRQNFPHIINLHEITHGVPLHIKTTLEDVIVTSFPAHHCPGSVMFLIENDLKRVLYTGDFRLNQKELQRISAFTEYKCSIDEIYLDSTFLSDDYKNFPSQEESCDAISLLIKNWTSMGTNKKIFLHTSARYGYEWMFIQLYKRTKMKIHVRNSEFDSYQYIPEMDDVITCYGQETQIHACNKRLKDCVCNEFSGVDDVRTIRISAMIWRNWKNVDKCVQKDGKVEELYRVCYSNHASLNEIREMLMFFKPKEVFLNVMPKVKSECDEMKNLLNGILAEYRKENGVKEEKQAVIDTDIQLSFSNIAKVGKRRKERDSRTLLNKVSKA